MNKRVTILDVARKAGVSKVTVSYVLNGRGPEMGIRHETAERIEQAAKDLGYRPNALARMLSKSRTETLAILFQAGNYFSRSAGFNGEILDGVSQACFREDFDLMLHTRQVKSAQEEADSMMDGRVDGILMLRDDGDPTLELLVSSGFPVVQFFSHGANRDIPSVDCDNVQAGRLAAEHLIELGHRKIAMATGTTRSVSATDRMNGVKDALNARGVTCQPEWLIPYSSFEGYVAAIKNLLTSVDPPSALIVWYDDLAIRLMNRLQSEGIQVPRDISIVGFDSLGPAESASPALTSVHQPVLQMAFEAALMLISLIRGQPLTNRQRVFEPRLDVRASTAPCP